MRRSCGSEVPLRIVLTECRPSLARLVSTPTARRNQAVPLSAAPVACSRAASQVPDILCRVGMMSPSPTLHAVPAALANFPWVPRAEQDGRCGWGGNISRVGSLEPRHDVCTYIFSVMTMWVNLWAMNHCCCTRHSHGGGPLCAVNKRVLFDREIGERGRPSGV